jgi:hypothetical protein
MADWRLVIADLSDGRLTIEIADLTIGRHLTINGLQSQSTIDKSTNPQSSVGNLQWKRTAV